MLRADVIIRCKNEERWLRRLLSRIEDQRFCKLSVILVDNQSIDKSVELASTFESVEKIIHIDEFRPGGAINAGCIAGNSPYLIIISAHCVPISDLWAFSLLSEFSDDSVAGVYGRQMPFKFSAPDDVRDLVLTFPSEDRLQTEDPSFHNANSAIRRDDWALLPFCDAAKHMEDRKWAARVLGKGRKIKYLGSEKASVLHYHGINQHGWNYKSFRVSTVVKQLANYAEESGIDLYEGGFLEKLDRVRGSCLIVISTGSESIDRSKEGLVRSRISHILSAARAASSEDELPRKCVLVAREDWIHASFNEDLLCVRTEISSVASTLSFLDDVLTQVEKRCETIFDMVQFFDLRYLRYNVDSIQDFPALLGSTMHDFLCPCLEDNGMFISRTDEAFTFRNDGFRVMNKDNYRICVANGGIFFSDYLRVEKGDDDQNSYMGGDVVEMQDFYMGIKLPSIDLFPDHDAS